MQKVRDLYKKAARLLENTKTTPGTSDHFPDSPEGIPPHKIAFVLSGGGPLGSIQVGVLEALFDYSIRPDMIIGTSVGALNGSWLATHPTRDGVQRMKKIWLSLKSNSIFTSGRVRVLARMILGRNYIYRDDGLRNLITDNLGDVAFEDLILPLYITATNLDTGELEVFNEGPIVPTVLASSAIPGVFPPVSINSHLYADGGIISHCALDVAVRNNATHIVLIECPHPKNGNGYGILSPISKSLRLMLNRACQLEKELFLSTQSIPAMWLEPPIDLIEYSATDFSKTWQLIEEARQWTTSYLRSHAEAFLASRATTCALSAA